MLNIFAVATEDGSFALTTAGYVTLAILLFLLLILASIIGSKNRKLSTKQLVFSAVAIALAFATSNLKLFHMPMGGSVTLFSMFFITLIGTWYGPSVGLMVGIAYGILQLMIDPYIISVPQMLVDYLLAFGALGISGFFSGKKNGMIIGYVAGVLGRYFFSVLSGVIFFGMWAPETMSPLTYSLAYNGGYLGAEALLTIIVLLVPAVRKGLEQVRRMAVE